eukprot:11969717-Prorocentrum_lima.AAC.1
MRGLHCTSWDDPVRWLWQAAGASQHQGAHATSWLDSGVGLGVLVEVELGQTAVVGQRMDHIDLRRRCAQLLWTSRQALG